MLPPTRGRWGTGSDRTHEKMRECCETGYKSPSWRCPTGWPYTSPGWSDVSCSERRATLGMRVILLVEGRSPDRPTAPTEGHTDPAKSVRPSVARVGRPDHKTALRERRKRSFAGWIILQPRNERPRKFLTPESRSWVCHGRSLTSCGRECLAAADRDRAGAKRWHECR